MPKRIYLPSSLKRESIKKRTSIGDGPRCQPKNKHKKRTWKKYRGQGK